MQGKGKDATADVEVKKGHTDQEKLGIAIAVLLEQEKAHLVDWVRSVRVFRALNTPLYWGERLSGLLMTLPNRRCGVYCRP